MSDEKLKEIEARLNAATPGPWKMYHHATEDLFIIKANDIYIAGIPTGSVNSDNFEFIENAPTDIAFLLSEVSRLNRVVKNLENTVFEVTTSDAVMEENARLREALKHYLDCPEPWVAREALRSDSDVCEAVEGEKK